MSDKFNICSRAFALIDAGRISSFGDPEREAGLSPEQEIAALLYEPTKRALLCRYLWAFNTTDMILNPEVETPLDRHWQYQYQQPADLLRLKTVMDRTGSRIPYLREKQRIYRNYRPILIKYQRDLVEDDFEIYFEELLVLRLAWRFSEKIVGEGATKDRLAREFRDEFEQAKNIDGSNRQPVQIIGRSRSWLRARLGYDDLRGDWSRYKF